MEVTFKTDVTQKNINELRKIFPKDSYDIQRTKVKNALIVKGYKLTAATVNSAKVIKNVSKAKLLPHWATIADKKVNLGLDLQGGMQVVLRANYPKIEKKLGRNLTDSEKAEKTAQALEKLNNRIDGFGVAEPSIRTKGVEAIEIQLPGVSDPEGVKDALRKTGRVEYKLVNKELDAKLRSYFHSNKITIPTSRTEQKELIAKMKKDIKISSDSEILFEYRLNRQTEKSYPYEPRVLHKKVVLDGDDISRAYGDRDQLGKLVVGFELTTKGSKKFSELTSSKNKGKEMAIIIDDNVRSAPRITKQINTRTAIIEGAFSIKEVNMLSNIMREGALPVDLEIIEERTVGPSLGQDSIESGIKAITIGLALIMLFMFIYYKVAGLIANVCLFLNMMFMLALLTLFGFTLTLPGIAGFILTVGMSVDANVIIFERIKEEQKNGKSPRTAILNGFDKAFWTICDANITTIIAALILYKFGTGPIKGFAVTLIIGILCSMFVALFISKFIYEVITSNKKIKKLSI